MSLVASAATSAVRGFCTGFIATADTLVVLCKNIPTSYPKRQIVPYSLQSMEAIGPGVTIANEGPVAVAVHKNALMVFDQQCKTHVCLESGRFDRRNTNNKWSSSQDELQRRVLYAQSGTEWPWLISSGFKLILGCGSMWLTRCSQGFSIFNQERFIGVLYAKEGERAAWVSQDQGIVAGLDGFQSFCPYTLERGPLFHEPVNLGGLAAVAFGGRYVAFAGTVRDIGIQRQAAHIVVTRRFLS